MALKAKYSYSVPPDQNSGSLNSSLLFIHSSKFMELDTTDTFSYRIEDIEILDQLFNLLKPLPYDSAAASEIPRDRISFRD